MENQKVTTLAQNRATCALVRYTIYCIKVTVTPLIRGMNHLIGVGTETDGKSNITHNNYITRPQILTKRNRSTGLIQRSCSNLINFTCIQYSEDVTT